MAPVQGLDVWFIFHQQRRNGRDQAACQQVNGNAVPVPIGEGDQCGGDKGSEPAAHDAGDLVTDSGTAVAITCTEHAGKHRLLYADHHIMSNIGQHDGEEHNPED